MARHFRHKRPANPEQDADIFKVLRALRGLKTGAIARESGLSPGTVSKWRTRRTRYPRHDSYQKALKVVKCRFAILDEEGNEIS